MQNSSVSVTTYKIAKTNHDDDIIIRTGNSLTLSKTSSTVFVD